MHRFRIGKKDHGIYGMAAAGQTVEIYRVDEIIKVHNTLILGQCEICEEGKEVRL